MTDKERQFFDRKLEATKNDEEAHDKVIAAVVKRCVIEAIEKREKEKLNKHYIETNFGI